ncbi:MAG: hypothetical protein ACLSAH_23510 [Bilophila wadsworthia]
MNTIGEGITLFWSGHEAEVAQGTGRALGAFLPPDATSPAGRWWPVPRTPPTAWNSAHGRSANAEQVSELVKLAND